MRNFVRRCLPLISLLLLGNTFAPEVQAQTVGPGDVLLSEFRLAGPNGFADEYIEFYCNRDTDCDISNYNVQAFDPSFGDFTIAFPMPVVIPARGFLLIGDDFGYSLPLYGQLDFFASFNGGADFFIDNQGFQLRNEADTVVIDSVGFIGGGGSYIEGTGLQRATAARPAAQYAYVRRQASGRPLDTNNNANDFALVSVTGTAHTGITAPVVLGAPGPQSLSSALEQTVKAHLVEPAVGSSSSPNRIRTGSGNSGTLSIRRTFTNNTTENITSLKFRVVDITTLNTPGSGPGQADLRLVTSPDAETFVNSQGRTVVIRGTVLEFDVTPEPAHPNGGGLNSSVNVNVGTGIAPAASVDVQFLLNVIQSGTFRFFVVVEGSTATPAGPSKAGRIATTARVEPRRMGGRKAAGVKSGSQNAAPKRAMIRRF